jgi:type IV pilus assembly protein PilB
VDRWELFECSTALRALCLALFCRYGYCSIMSVATPLGELLVRVGFVTQEQVDRVLEEQAALNAAPAGVPVPRFGELLVAEGLLKDAQLTQVLSQQLSVPWVSLKHIEFTRTLLELVLPEVAERYRVLPIHVRRIRGLGNVLYVAIADPLDREALSAVADASGLPVRPMIACQRDIAIGLHTYYGLEVPGLPDESETSDGIESINPEPVSEASPSLRSPPPLSRRAAPRSQPSAEPPSHPTELAS